MNKPDSLRAWLKRALVSKGHDVDDNPDRLTVLIQEGTVHSTLTAGLAFEYRYTVELILLDFHGHPDDVLAPVLLWIRTWQPELAANREKLARGLRFNAEHLGDGKVDMMVQVDLTEICRMDVGADGLPTEVEHLDKPLEPERDWGPLHQVDANGAEAAHCTAHPEL